MCRQTCENSGIRTLINVNRVVVEAIRVKILVVSQYFWPENFRVNDLCVELQKRGHQSYCYDQVFLLSRGQVFAGYSENSQFLIY